MVANQHNHSEISSVLISQGWYIVDVRLSSPVAYARLNCNVVAALPKFVHEVCLHLDVLRLSEQDVTWNVI